MAKRFKPNPTVLFDIEAGGLHAHKSSILSIAYKRGTSPIQELYAHPAKGSWLSKWSETQVLSRNLQRLSKLRRKAQSEQEVLTNFLNFLKSHVSTPGAEIAGFNIGYTPKAQPFGTTRMKGFDIPFIMTRAKRYGLEKQFGEVFKKAKIRDIGAEWAVRIAEMVSRPKYKGLVDPALHQQAVGLQKAFAVAGLSSAPLAVRARFMQDKGLKFSGWKQEVVHSLLGLGEYSAHMAHEDIAALAGSKMLDPSQVIRNEGQFVAEWGKAALLNKLVSTARWGGKDLGELQAIARRAGIYDQFMSKLNLQLSAVGATLEDIAHGRGIPEGFAKVTEAVFAPRLTPFAGKTTLAGEFIARHKVGLGIGLGVAGLWALNHFSGKDDEYNTLEGLNHGGIAEQKRHELTAFGSGYKGLNEKDAQTIHTIGNIVGIVGAGLFLHGSYKTFKSWKASGLSAGRYLKDLSLRPTDELENLLEGGLGAVSFVYGKFSGKDDAYNKIEGLQHGGVAEKKRHEMTAFGSGWIGEFAHHAPEIAPRWFGDHRIGADVLNYFQNNFSGRDDRSNTIEGLSHRGIGWQSRRRYTDFGSGYQGLGSSEEYQSQIEERFEKLTTALEMYGKELGTGHKRILIPKKILSQQDLEEVLGFVPVAVAVPESGQTRIESYRNPNNLYHLHEHGDAWTMHRDEDPAATMLLKKWANERVQSPKPTSVMEPLKLAIRGIPHVVTEGVPGMYYWLKGQMFGGEDMRSRLEKELPQEYNKFIAKFKHLEPPSLLSRLSDQVMGQVNETVHDIRDLGTRIISGRDDHYNTIEGLRHGGMAASKRHEMTDFGSGWIRKALSKGIAASRVASGAATLVPGLEKAAQSKWAADFAQKLVKDSPEALKAFRSATGVHMGGERWVFSRHLGQGGLARADLVIGTSSKRMGVLKTLREGVSGEFERGATQVNPFIHKQIAEYHGKARGQKLLDYIRGYGKDIETFAASKQMNVLEYEAHMQKAARAQFGDVVPNVFAESKTGFIQEFGGLRVAAEQESGAAQWIRSRWGSMLESNTGVIHHDPHMGNIVRQGGRYRIIDWGASSFATQEGLDARLTAKKVLNEWTEEYSIAPVAAVEQKTSQFVKPPKTPKEWITDTPPSVNKTQQAKLQKLASAQASQAAAFGGKMDKTRKLF